MRRQFSNEAKDLLKTTKKIAKRLENNYIGIGHFVLCFNAFNYKARLPFCIGYSTKREIIQDIKGKKLDIKGKREFTLTKHFEEVLTFSKFHCWVMGEKIIRPEHIYLSLIGSDRANKLLYLDLLKSINIHLPWFKSLIVNYYFTSFFHKIVKHIIAPLKFVFIVILAFFITCLMIILNAKINS